MDSGDYNCGCNPTGIVSVEPCEPSNPRASLRKLVELMENPISADFYERQLIILKDFVACTVAFWVQDLPYIMRLLELLIDILDSICLFEKPFKEVLALCGIPPILTCTSEAIERSRDIQQYFSFLGYLLIRVQEKAFQDLVIRALRELLVERNTPCERCHVTLQICFENIEKSQLPEVLTRILELAEEDLYEKLLDIVLIMANISHTVCQKMIRMNIIDNLLTRLDPAWKTRNEIVVPNTYETTAVQYFEITSNILWKIFDAFMHSSDQFRKTVALPTSSGVRSLRYVLRSFTLNKRAKLNRNHILMIAVQLLECFPKIQLSNTGFRRDISILSTSPEISLGGTWAAEVKYTSHELDYEFKKMLLLVLCYLCKIPSSIKFLQPKRIIPALLKLTQPEFKTPFHPQQQRNLISIALRTLQTLLPELLDDFFYFDGPHKVLMLVDYFNMQMCDLPVLRDALNLLHSVCCLGRQHILQNLLMHDAYSVLCSLCQNLLSNRTLKLIMQRCLAYIFSILEQLCRTQHASEASTIQLCITFMKRVVKPNAVDPLFDPNFLICGVYFLWEGIVWTQHNLKSFISIGGVYLLLDLFEKSVFPVKLATLGVLVDMCYEGSCVPHLITWRKNGKKLLPMLLALFREENIRLGVKTAADGTIADVEVPLMGQQQWYETFYANKDPNSSPAVVDLLASCRPKIYAIIHLLNTRHEIRVDLANEVYSLYSTEELDITDQITLLLAENFLALKLGEVWVELNRDIEKAGIRPLAIDGEVMSFLIRRFHKWSFHIKTVQEALLNKDLQNEMAKEVVLYTTLKESRLTDALKALNSLDFIARTTERMFRLIAKMKQTTEIEASLRFTRGAAHHRTSLHTIRVNPVFNQAVNIQSNTIVDPNDRNGDILPVSSSSESSLILEPEEEIEEEMLKKRLSEFNR